MSINTTTSKLAQLRSTAGRMSAVAAVLGALTLTLAAPAQAQLYRESSVKFEDLDLSQSQDVQRLYTRLQQAAKSVCRDREGRLQHQRQSFKQCYNTALDGAVSNVNVAQLTKLHTSRDTMTVARARKSQDAG